MIEKLTTANQHLFKYHSLIYELVIRDLKVKYRRSFLGYLWSLLNPLMMMAVMATVFSHVFRARSAAMCAASAIMARATPSVVHCAT